MTSAMQRRSQPGWDVGERPKKPMAYFQLPMYQFTEAHVRHEDGSFKSETTHDHAKTVARREHQRREGQGWMSKLHRNTLDYRTVDNLGLTPEELDLGRKPAVQTPRLQIFEPFVPRDVEEGHSQAAIPLENGKPTNGWVPRFEYKYYKILIPHKHVTLRVSVKAQSGDPDIFICNRHINPNLNEHTWKSQGTGDDTVTIHPDDPMFYPGAFYIGIYSVYDSSFQLCARYVRQRVKATQMEVLEGDGFVQVRDRLGEADLRRRFCRNGAGFLEQLESPRSLHLTPRQTSPSQSPSRGPHRVPHRAAAKEAEESGGGDGEGEGDAGGDGERGGGDFARDGDRGGDGGGDSGGDSAEHSSTVIDAWRQALSTPRELDECGSCASALRTDGSTSFRPTQPSSLGRSFGKARATSAKNTPRPSVRPVAFSADSQRRGATCRSVADATRDAKMLSLSDSEDGREGHASSHVSDNADGTSNAGAGSTLRAPSKPAGSLPHESSHGLCAVAASDGPGDDSCTSTSFDDTKLEAILTATVASSTPRGQIDSARRSRAGPGRSSASFGRAKSSRLSAALRPMTAPANAPSSPRKSPHDLRQTHRSDGERQKSPGKAQTEVAMSPSYWLRSGAGKEAAEAVGKRELIARTAGANSTATAAATAAVLRCTFPEKCSRLKQARAKLAECYGLTPEELARRDGIPKADVVTLNRGEFATLQHLLRKELDSSLEAQDEARHTTYRFRSKAAQHLNPTAPSNWSPETACELIDREAARMQRVFLKKVKDTQVEHEKREEEMKSQEARMLNQQRLRKAMFASRISSRLMSPPGNRPPRPWAAEDSSAVADEDANVHASTESGYER